MPYTCFYRDVYQPLGVLRADRDLLPSIFDQAQHEPSETIAIVAQYLRSGFYLSQIPGEGEDAFAPGRATVLGVQTDGVWLWPSDAAYYCESYGILPNAEVVASALHRGGVCPVPGESEIRRLIASFYRSH